MLQTSDGGGGGGRGSRGGGKPDLTVGLARLTGRQTAVAKLKQTVELATQGSGQVLVLVGEAGIGKSTLLDTVPELTPSGSIVICIRAVESESHLAFASVIDLLGPLLLIGDVGTGIPKEAKRLLDDLVSAKTAATETMKICRAALGALLAVASSSRLVVFVVDDAQWLDDSSAEILLYLARRLSNDHVALFAAVRSGTPSRLLATDLPQLVVDGLLSIEADQLLGPYGVDHRVIAALHGATGGNPLAMLEIVKTLTSDERSGRAVLPEFPSVGTTISQAYERRIAELPSEVREALVVVAAFGSGPASVLYRALDTIGHPPSVLAVAEQHEILGCTGGEVMFVHPLLRLASYSGASLALRRQVHASLAEAWGTEQPTRGAWHLGESAAYPDESTASWIESVASEALNRCAATVAGDLFAKSAELSTNPVARERRWMAAAQCFAAAGKPSRSVSMANNVVSSTADPRLRSDAIMVTGMHMAFAESPMGACDLLGTESLRVANTDPLRAVLLLTTAFTAAFLALEFRIGDQIAAELAGLAADAGPVGVLISNTTQMQSALLAGRSDEAQALLGPIEQLAENLVASGVAEADSLLQSAAFAYLVVDRSQDAHDTATAVIRRHRAAGREGDLPFAFAVACEAALRLGRWSEAYSDARRAGDPFSDPADSDWATLSSQTLCARVEAHLGLSDECRHHANSVIDKAGKLGLAILVISARHSLGSLALSHGNHQEAIHQLQMVAEAVEHSGVHDPGYLWWAGDLIEAYWRGDQTADAMRIRATLAIEADLTNRKSAQMIVARADGLLGPPDRAVDCFERSIAIGREVGTPFEIARSNMLCAEFLIARGSEATASLDAALTIFERLGATIWAQRCRSLGPTNAPLFISPTRLLADRELETALLAARGMTNQEIGDEMYLSPKTVENVLGRVYRKLSVRSRTELANLMNENVRDEKSRGPWRAHG